jgi:hypothetical protein
LISRDRDGKVGAPYGTAGGIPVMVMLHRDGNVANIHVGYGEDMLDSLVAEITACSTNRHPGQKRSPRTDWPRQAGSPRASRKPRTSQSCRCTQRRVACGNPARRSA